MTTKHTTETNTLVLIREWSMAGARGDLGSHFGSPIDIHAAVAELSDEPVDEDAPPGRAPLLMKPAGEDDWQLLASNAA